MFVFFLFISVSECMSYVFFVKAEKPEAAKALTSEI